MSSQASSILILGGGTAGWACAAVLAQKAADAGVELTVVDCDEIPTIGVGEATIPTIYDLLRHTGIEDSELFAQAEASFKYGIRFEGWSVPGDQYMHGFGTTGAPYHGKSFFSAWLAAAAYFTSRDLGPFTPAVAAATKGRFSRVATRPEGAPDHIYYPLAELSYALHFDAALLARLLRERATAAGVRHVRQKIVDVACGPQGIVSLTTDDGKSLDADFYVDCSGLYGRLSKGALDSRFEDWRKFLPCNRAVALQSGLEKTPNAFTRSIAHRAGWRWEIQLQNRIGNGCVYCSDFMEDDEAIDLLLVSATGQKLTEPRLLRFETGRLHDPWTANCAAIGLAAGFLEPLESTSIHLISKYALMLESALFGNAPLADQRARFNRTWRDETSEIRDFLMAHYVVNSRSEPFWEERRRGPRPESLSAHFAAFERDGWIDLPDQALFGHDSWYQVLIGQRYPLAYERFAAPRDMAAQLVQFLENVGQAVERETSAIRHSHADIIAELSAKREP